MRWLRPRQGRSERAYPEDTCATEDTASGQPSAARRRSASFCWALLTRRVFGRRQQRAPAAGLRDPEAAVDREDGAVDVRGGRRGEERDRSRRPPRALPAAPPGCPRRGSSGSPSSQPWATTLTVMPLPPSSTAPTWAIVVRKPPAVASSAAPCSGRTDAVETTKTIRPGVSGLEPGSGRLPGREEGLPHAVDGASHSSCSSSRNRPVAWRPAPATTTVSSAPASASPTASSSDSAARDRDDRRPSVLPHDEAAVHAEELAGDVVAVRRGAEVDDRAALLDRLGRPRDRDQLQGVAARRPRCRSPGELSLSCDFTQPGPMWFTVMPCSPSSIAIVSRERAHGLLRRAVDRHRREAHLRVHRRGEDDPPAVARARPSPAPPPGRR